METFKKLISGKLLTSFAVIFMFSLITLLSSCTAVVRTPRHARSNVVIESPVQIRGDRHDNGRHLGRVERREKRNHHHND